MSMQLDAFDYRAGQLTNVVKNQLLKYGKRQAVAVAKSLGKRTYDAVSDLIRYAFISIVAICKS